jgi:hypothetical protein
VEKTGREKTVVGMEQEREKLYWEWNRKGKRAVVGME